MKKSSPAVERVEAPRMSSRPPKPALDALVVSEDPETLRTISNAVTGMGDRAVAVRDLAEAIALAGSLRPALAFVDVTLAGGGGLALVHHLPAVHSEIAVYVMAPGSKLHIALEGLTLGATGMLTLPPSGDAVMRAIGEVRERLAASVQHAGQEEELSLQRRRGDHMHRLVRIAAKAGWTELARMVGEAVAELTRAHAVSAYRAAEGTLMRVSLVGTSDAPDEVKAESELDAFGEIFSVGTGALLVEKGQENRRGLAAELTGFATALFGLSGHAGTTEAPESTRFEPLARFALLAVREVEKARRYKRQVTFAAMKPIDNQAPANAPKLEDLFQILIRDGDVLGRDDAEEEVLLMLPDTGSLGGQLFRRRFGLRALGLATFPQDGSTSERLVRVARQRAEDARRSPVRMLGLAPKGLREIIESLLDCPMFDAGLGSSYPLDLSLPAALSLVEHACLEARRGGAVSIVVAAHGKAGFASAVREACRREGEKVNLVEVDLHRLVRGNELEAVVVAAEHGTWICCGTSEKDRIKAVHAADAMLADLLAIKLLEVAAQIRGLMSDAPTTTLDLLRDLARAKKSGTLFLRGEKGTAEIRLALGNIEDAVHGRADGEKALYRALTIPVAQSSFTEGSPSGLPRISTPTNTLLDGAAAVLEAITNLREAFPDAATRPIVAADTGGAHGEISDHARALLHHLRTPLLIDNLLDAVPGPDAHTLRAVAELEEAGRIRHLASTLSRTALASHEQHERLRTMATLGLRRGFGKRVRLVFAGTPGRLAILAHATQCLSGAKSAGVAPSVPMPHPIVRIDLGPELELELVSLPLVPAYAPLWQMALTGAAIVVRLEEAGGSLLEEACEAAGAKIVDAHMLVGPYDEGNVAEVAVLVRAALEA